LISAVVRITREGVENLSVFLKEKDRIFSKTFRRRFFAKPMLATAAVRAASIPNASDSIAASTIMPPRIITNRVLSAISSAEKYFRRVKSGEP